MRRGVIRKDLTVNRLAISNMQKPRAVKGAHSNFATKDANLTNVFTSIFYQRNQARIQYLQQMIVDILV